MRHAVFSILVENSSGVLSRVAGLLVEEAIILTVLQQVRQQILLSRMTITVTGEEDVLEQIEKQMRKIIDVKEIVELPADSSVCRELILVKVLCDSTRRSEIASISDIFRANIVDVSTDSVIVELTGSQSKLNAFIELLSDFKITELARTGITGLARGTASLK